jgi:Aldehyde dehydrogenase family
MAFDFPLVIDGVWRDGSDGADVDVLSPATGNSIEIETHPIGVVAAFTPWNFPMALAAKKFAGALGAGCSIICKPSQETPGSVLALAERCSTRACPRRPLRSSSA